MRIDNQFSCRIFSSWNRSLCSNAILPNAVLPNAVLPDAVLKSAISAKSGRCWHRTENCYGKYNRDACLADVFDHDVTQLAIKIGTDHSAITRELSIQ
jgi:hypothetical protein